jgi:cytochrome c oxidase subunit 1
MISSVREPTTSDGVATRSASHWLGLSLAVLTLAGLFSLIVVIGRMPPFDRLVTDPLFFKRGLVVHVNLALVAWFYSFVVALLFLLPGRPAPGRIGRNSVFVSVAGVAMMLVAVGLPGTQPVLSNYVPVIDHWLFTAGQVLFAVGVLSSFIGRSLFRRAPALAPEERPESAAFPMPGAAQIGLRATAAGLVLAAITFGITAFRITPGLEVDVYYELLFWGGGHVLQLCCSTAMVSVWLILLHSATGRSPISTRAAAWLFFAMMVPWLMSPVLAMQGTWSPGYRDGFTSLMRWSIFPVVSLFLIACLRQLWLERKAGRLDASMLMNPRITGFLVSAALTLLGFGLGAAIRGSNTMIPAHYHASIGGVTAAFMTVTYLMLHAYGCVRPSARLRRAASWQPVVYGVGQMIFATGFGLAGVYGMSRKAYGAEQASRGLAESIGLGVMGLGGLLAIVGGILFLAIVAAIWRPSPEVRTNALEGATEA